MDFILLEFKIVFALEIERLQMLIVYISVTVIANNCPFLFMTHSDPVKLEVPWRQGRVATNHR